MTLTAAVVAVIVTVGVGVSSMRWLRVAQREHYLTGSVSLFFGRWVRSETLTMLALALALVAVGHFVFAWNNPLLAGVAVGMFLWLFSRRLSIKGVSSPLRWTDRLKRVAWVTGLLWLVVAVLGLFYPSVVLVGGLAFPLLIDGTLLVLGPVERRMSERWVRDAAAKIQAVGPTVVAITGSYGKTTTKEYVRQLVADRVTTVVSPASFNNRMGLARAVNEHLVEGVGVFVAEMGTYGVGEIADLCQWIGPDIAVMTAIGPVHLERFGTLETTLAAKAEILEQAAVAVLNIDDPMLARLADTITDRTVITVSATGTTATVSMQPIDSGFRVLVHGRESVTIGPVALPSNFACALGVAMALDVPFDDVARVVENLERPQHRQSQYVSDAGFTIIDDTYNSNPAGAAAALGTLHGLDAKRRVVVTPGMVELGPVQAQRNREFGAAAAKIADDVLIVGRTNLAALEQGTSEGDASVILFPSRAEAVGWVRSQLEPGDAVLYENDLPDHYP